MSGETTQEASGTRRGYVPEGLENAFAEGSGPEGDGPAGGRPARRAPEDGPRLPTLGWRGTLRWMWRQLTSMRVALLLLMLLAVAAVPGSILPQRSSDPAGVVRYLADNPTSGRWLERLGFFEVYSSPWFSAIYILLFVSLVGCIVPRAVAHGRALRARPPRTPVRFTRFPAQASGSTDRTPDEVADAAAAHLRGRVRWLPTFRVETGTDAQGRRTVAAERGYLRETGNILFHLSLLVLLVSVATGQLLHYRAQVIVTEGKGFANSQVDYDTFESGALFRPSSLDPFSITLDSFEATFTQDSAAQARDFTAHVTVRTPGDDGGTTSRDETIKVNHPLDVGGAKVYLQGNGYAPSVTVRDAKGAIAFEGPVTFIPQDTMYTSRGVIKVPDVSPGLEQLGIVGFLLPTAQEDANGDVVPTASVYPQPVNPVLVLNVWKGNLGLDDGAPQNVYRLDTQGMTVLKGKDGQQATLVVRPGETVDLPDGQGTLTFDSLPRYVALDLRYDPALTVILVFALLALLGLSLSLFTPRRRVWLRAWTEDGSACGPPRTVVDAAGLARGDDGGLQREVDAALDASLGPDGTRVPSDTPDPSAGSARRKATR